MNSPRSYSAYVSGSPPGDVQELQRHIRGLVAAQARSPTAKRDQQIAEFRYDLEKREKKFAKLGYW